MVERLVDKLIQANIRLELFGADQLKVYSDTKSVPADLMTEIRDNKMHLINYLRAHADTRQFQEIPTAPVQQDYPLSASQYRLWLLSHFEESNSAYNMPGVYNLEGSLDRSALSHSFGLLLRRHEILRTVFVTNQMGEVRQQVRSVEECGFYISFESLIGQNAEALQQRLQYNVETPFDLSQGPLVRVSVYQMTERSWVLNYVMHHIISDGWSMRVLIKELLDYYHRYQRGDLRPLPPLRLQYKDFASWQRSEMESGNLQVARDYWLKKLAAPVPILQIPADRPRPAIRTYCGSVIHLSLSHNLSQRLTEMAKARNCTLFMVLLAGVKILLHRYTGQVDLTVGTPIAGREHADLEEQIGFYVNTLVLRTKLKSDGSFLELLDAVKNTTLEAYEFQAYPFDAVVENLHLKADRSRNPLFDVMVILQNHAGGGNGEAKQSPDVRFSSYDGVQQRISKFDLTFTFMQTQQGIDLEIEFNTSLFNKATACRMGDHLSNLLRSVIENPEKSVRELECLAAEEKWMLLSDFNHSGANYDHTATLVGLFEEQVEKTPHQIAVVCGEERLSYRELNNYSNQLAMGIRQEYRVVPDERVGVSLERGIPMVVSLLAVLKSGGAYVPIDPQYPEERKAFMLSDSGCKVLIDETLYKKLLDRDYNRENPDRINSPSDLAYVIYTSGSTGKPKGVLIQHNHVVRLLTTDQSPYDFGPEDVWPLFHSFCFDVSVWEMYGALLFGGRLIIVPFITTRDPGAFLDLMIEEKVTILNQTPSAFYPLIESELERREAKLQLRYVIFAGEALSPEKLSGWKARYPKTRLINMYGITETTVHVTFRELTSEDIRTNSSNVGIPLPTLKLYILDQFNQPCPIGVVGEICVGGVGVARGYLNRPELTAKKFVPDPFDRGQRMYRSGDLGRWMADGTVECKGRMDHQVKIRGHRVELGEVEHLLEKHPAIDTAIVLVRESDAANKELVAYVKSERELQVWNIRDFLAQSLPSYMIPGYYIPIEHVPLTPNGKLDRSALPVPDQSRLIAGCKYVEPRNALEGTLLDIWCEVLKCDAATVGIDHDFFDLGGNSLNGMKVIKRFRDHTKVNLGLQTLFTEKTIRKISRSLTEKGKQPAGNQNVDTAERPAGELYDSSYNQLQYFSDWDILGGQYGSFKV